MSNKPLNISESAAVQMPMKTVVSLIALVAIGTWAYFGLHETLNKHSTQIELMQKDLEHNTEFRIKWPRGQMGSLPADQEQFMMIEDLYKSVDRLNKAIEDGMHNKVNIEFLQKQATWANLLYLIPFLDLDNLDENFVNNAKNKKSFCCNISKFKPIFKFPLKLIIFNVQTFT